MLWGIMRRREFLAALGAAFVAIDARAQQPTQQLGPKKRIAIVSTTTKVEDFKRHPAHRLFDDELKRAGFVEGENLTIDYYSAEGRSDQYESLAREVVATNPDLIYTGGTPMTLKLKAATSTIPIVTATGDPIRLGIISSLAHPGGNITGVSVDAGIESGANVFTCSVKQCLV
jgi:putative tryptophan/tyrosine transport system substrate-binding protein